MKAAVLGIAVAPSCVRAVQTLRPGKKPIMQSMSDSKVRWSAVSVRFKRAVLAVVVAVALAAAAAADGEPGPPPKFFIEKITVEAPRLSPDIVLSESLLRAGNEYSEAELSEAVHRINRLPFVLLAEFSLRKGSERDRYELVVKVFEARRWFFHVDGDWQVKDFVDRLDPRVETVLGDRIGDPNEDARSLVGRRFAVGNRGLLFASLGSEDGAFAVGYQRYNLWNRNILLSLSLGAEDQVGKVLFATDTFVARAQLGIPIRGNHALRLLATRTELDRNFGGFGIDQETTEAEVAWIFNSLDDPVLPRQGSVYEAGLTWLDTRDVHVLRFGNVPTRFESSYQSLGAIASAGRYWPVAERQSLSAGIRGFLDELPGDGERREAEVSFGHQVFLLRRLELDKWRELRWENQLSGLRQEFSVGPSFAEVGLTDAGLDSWEVRTGLVYRNGWGLFRLFYSSADVDRYRR